jgi:hypothetical protein
MSEKCFGDWNPGRHRQSIAKGDMASGVQYNEAIESAEATSGKQRMDGEWKIWAVHAHRQD